MPNILIENNFYQGTSQACIIDLTPPTFAGITFLDVESRGQIRSGWSAATDATAPIRYEVYIKASTATGLFSTTNIIAVTPNLQYDIFTLPDGSFLQNGATYYVGVRAIDGVNNRDSNTVSQSVISTGVLTAIDVYETKASWSVDNTNQFNITMWANKNDSLAISPSATLGTASYQVYTKGGTAIVGMSGSGITANSEGLYVATPVANSLNADDNHYEIKVSISVDSEVRTNFIPFEENPETVNINGTVSLDSSNTLIGSFWVTQSEKVVETSLGTGSYEVYDSGGNLVVGLSESGISANSDGFFSITPFSLPGSVDTTVNYIARITLTVNGLTKSTNIVINATPADYSVSAVFSINALNQLHATFWGTLNSELVDPTLVTTASYTIYDKNGTAVVGLTQTGITPDAQGLFHITPVAATLLSDLTHYSAKVTVNVAGQARTAIKAFTLLGT